MAAASQEEKSEPLPVSRDIKTQFPVVSDKDASQSFWAT